MHTLLLIDTISGIADVGPIEILAPLVAIIAALALTHPTLNHLGDDTEFWRSVRRYLPGLDEEARDRGFYTEYDIGDEEIAGVAYLELEELETTLQELNFRPSPLAAHKLLPDDRREIRSWGRYGGVDVDALPWPFNAVYLLMYPYQDPHVTLFPAERGDVGDEEIPDGAVLVTAHHEKSPYNPLVAYEHLRGKGYDVDRGVEMTAEMLVDELDDDFAPFSRAIALAGDVAEE